MDVFPAHIRNNQSGDNELQTATEHCRNVAQYAAKSLDAVGLACSGELAGVLHDAGKFGAAFAEYITRLSAGEKMQRGSVNHTFAGVRLLFERYYSRDGSPYRNMTCEMLAFAAGAHHGLFDCIDPQGQDGFEHRLDTAIEISYREVKGNFLAQCANEAELDRLFDQAAREVEQAMTACKASVQTKEELLYALSLLCRLLLSAVIDGDRQDTAEFVCNFSFAEFPSDMRPIWSERLAVVDRRLDSLSADSPINIARRTISRQCRSFAADDSGVYRLSVPTGGGKTLATLRFALATAAQHNKARIFFVIPLLSVLEQNAKVIREYLECDELVLEHHSNVVDDKADGDKLNDNELLAETWHSPVVITTMVQLLNTLFSGKTTCVRRMNALVNSVIVIDEIQSLPRNMISQFNLAVNFLARVCHATVVLCSATQPCLESVKHKMQYSSPADIVPYSPDVWMPFRRAQIIDHRKTDGYTAGELADLALSVLPECGSVLVICNKKGQAAELYGQLCNCGVQLFHLSTSMCMAHRIDTLEQINACLGNKPIICVATQLVEAGVDFSFGCVIRVSAGMDNVVQAAGRCNRHGEQNRLCPVYIVNWQKENLAKLKEIHDAQAAAEELLYRFKCDAAEFDDYLQSDKAISYYYRRLFTAMPQLAQDYPVTIRDAKIKTTILEMLSGNNDFRFHGAKDSPRIISQAFMTAGKEFKVFDDNTTDLIVPYKEGEELIAELCTGRAEKDYLHRKYLVDRAKKYTVSLFNYQLSELAANGGVQYHCDGSIASVLANFYCKDIGLVTSGGDNKFLEV